MGTASRAAPHPPRLALAPRLARLAVHFFGLTLAHFDLDSLMSQISSYKDGKQTCRGCVAEGKEWCVVYDACDVEECEEEDVVRDCEQLDLNRRPELAAGVLVEVLAPKETLLVESHEDKFWHAVKKNKTLLQTWGLGRFAEDATASCEETASSASEPPLIGTAPSSSTCEETASSASVPSAPPLIGTVVRAYHHLDEFTVKDDEGFEIKHRIRHGPKQNEKNTQGC